MGFFGDGLDRNCEIAVTTRQYAPNSSRPGLTRPLTSEDAAARNACFLVVPVSLKIAARPQSIEGATHTVSATGALGRSAEGQAIHRAPRSPSKIHTRKPSKLKSHVRRQFSSEGRWCDRNLHRRRPTLDGFFRQFSNNLASTNRVRLAVGVAGLQTVHFRGRWIQINFPD